MLKLPAAARRASVALMHHRGVVGVFWGSAERKGKRRGEHCLIVHVRRKLPDKLLGPDRIPASIGGFRTDVIEVGNVTHHWLDPSDLIRCEDDQRGRSTITALGEDGDDVYALVSGHGTLPAANGQIVSKFDPSSPMRVRALDPSGVVFAGDLQSGCLDASRDFAIALMAARVDDVNAYHYATGSYPPFTVRSAALQEAEEVAHFSAIRGRRMIGRVRQIAAGFVNIPGYGGNDYPYLDLAFIESIDDSVAFSVKGDSGSLVVDRKQRVIGTVVAGEPDQNLCYVLPVHATVDALGPFAHQFFQNEE